MMNGKSIFKTLGLFSVVIGTATTLFLAGNIVETNSPEYYQIKQAAVSGELSLKDTAGMYPQMFGKITTYRKADDLGIHNTTVRFRDGSTATITGTVKFRAPISYDQRMKAHTEMQSYSTMKANVNEAVEGALKQTANLFGAEEVYSTKRSEFIEMFRGQLMEGIYKTSTGKSTNEIVYNDDGFPVIAKPSVLAEYGLSVVNIEINDIDFDQKTDELIAARKDAEQQETLARAEAVRAQQDALTAEERGKAQVAKAKYDALVVKEKAVIEAQKQTAIEQERTLQAIEQAKQIEANGEAEASRQKALVEAGLSPREQAEFDMRTAIGVAEAMKGLQFPSVMVFGGGEGTSSSPMNPFDAVGLQAFQQMAKDKQLQSNHHNTK